MAKRLEDMLWKNIRTIKSESDEAYVRSILEARADFLRLRLKQEPAIRQIYTNTATNVANEIRAIGAPSGKGAKLKRAHLVALEKSLRKEADSITQALTGVLGNDIAKAVEAGANVAQTRLLKLISESNIKLDTARVQRGFAQVNAAAVEACWSRTHKGLNLSDRIWRSGDNARTTMQTIIQEGVAQGRDAVAIAKDLEKYVRSGANTLAKDYPNMRERMKRVPKDMSYEALRLARTETANAYWEGTISSSRTSPTCKGVRFMLASTHPIEDICDNLASADLYGLGPGGYATGDEPPLPHPNCLCMISAIMPTLDEIEARWEEWENDPSSHPEIEKWYNEVYSKEQPPRVAAEATVAKAKPPASTRIVDLPGYSKKANENVAAAFDEALGHGLKDGTEVMVSINPKDGTKIHPNAVGDKNSVVLPGSLIDELNYAEANSLVLIHNHPSSSSFSDADVNILVKHPSVKWIAVIGHDETIYALKVGRGKRPDFRHIARSWERAQYRYYDHYNDLVMSGKMTSGDAWYMHTHRIMTDVAKDYGWTYIRMVPSG